MSRTKTLPDTGRVGRRLAAWFAVVGVTVLDVHGSKHWRVRVQGPSGLKATVTFAHSPSDEDAVFEALVRQTRRRLSLPRNP